MPLLRVLRLRLHVFHNGQRRLRRRYMDTMGLRWPSNRPHDDVASCYHDMEMPAERLEQHELFHELAHEI